MLLVVQNFPLPSCSKLNDRVDCLRVAGRRTAILQRGHQDNVKQQLKSFTGGTLFLHDFHHAIA